MRQGWMNSGNPELSHRLACGGKTQRKALRYIITTMRQHSWNLTHTAKALRVTHRSLRRWILRYPILAEAHRERRDYDAVQSMRPYASNVIVNVIGDST